MKLKLFFILILAFACILCGCKQEPVEATVPTTVATEPPTEPPAPKAGLLVKNLNADEQDGLNIRATLEGLGYEVLLRDAENDQSKQNQQVTALLDGGCQLLVLQPVMVSGLDVLLKEVTQVPVIVLDAQPNLGEGFENVKVLCPRQEQAGTVEATLLSSLPGGGDLNGDGQVSMILVNGPEDHLDATSRKEAFLAGINAETHIVLETVSDQWTEEGGKAACGQMLSKYGPDAEVIVTFGEEMAIGAIHAIENGGWTPGTDVYLLSIGSSTTARNETRLGRISGLSAPDAALRLQLLEQLVKGEITEKVNFIEYITTFPQ